MLTNTVASVKYRAMNPNPKVPTLEIHTDGGDGVALWESNSIVRFLARKYKPDLLGIGCDIKTAKIEKWMDWQLALRLPLGSLHDNIVRLPEEKRDSNKLVPDAKTIAEKLVRIRLSILI